MFKGHPKGLLAAALSNMGERFGYYIMNAVLVLFLCSKFGLNEAVSGTIYSCCSVPADNNRFFPRNRTAYPNIYCFIIT